MNLSRKPQVIRRCDVPVKLHMVSDRPGGSACRQFVLARRNAEGKRETRQLSDAEQARTEAELTVTTLVSGEADVPALSSVEHAQYLRAKAHLWGARRAAAHGGGGLCRRAETAPSRRLAGDALEAHLAPGPTCRNAVTATC